MFNPFSRKPFSAKPFSVNQGAASVVKAMPAAVVEENQLIGDGRTQGLPAVSVTSVMRTQAGLIGRLRDTLRLDGEAFGLLARPVIERYAAYVHLLPATRSHHHSGAGGLFLHGLEVALWAAQRAESHPFPLSDARLNTPRARREGEPRWQFAAFMAGLLHDMGKPLAGMMVTDISGRTCWNPYDMSLADWCQHQSLHRYRLSWQERLEGRRARYSLMNLNLVLTPEARAYLNAPGPHFMEAMLDALTGAASNSLLGEIVYWADEESVRRHPPEGVEAPPAMPSERRLQQALRRYVDTARVNEPGAVVWRLESGVYLAWPSVVPKLLELMSDPPDGALPGADPTPDADALADALIHCGMAVAGPEAGRYWRIYPEALQGVPLNCLRLELPELVFRGALPSSVAEGGPRAVTPAGAEAHEPTAAPSPTQTEAPPAPDPAVAVAEVSTETVDAEPGSIEPVAEPKIVELKVAEPMVEAAMPAAKAEAPGDSPAWQIIHKAVKRSAEGKPSLERLPDGDFGIPYPAWACFLGDPKEVMNQLAEEGLLRHDPASTAKTTMIGGKKYLVLCRRVSRFIGQQVERNLEI